MTPTYSNYTIVDIKREYASQNHMVGTFTYYYYVVHSITWHLLGTTLIQYYKLRLHDSKIK